jgi:hypothetical protein
VPATLDAFNMRLLSLSLSHAQPVQPGQAPVFERSPESELILAMALIAVLAIVGFFLVTHFRRRLRRRAARRRSGRRQMQA